MVATRISIGARSAGIGILALALAGCGGDAMSRFTGGTSSRDKQAEPTTVQAGQPVAVTPASAASPQPGGTAGGVEGPAVATKSPEAANVAEDGALRKTAMMYKARKSRDPFMSLVSSEGDNRTDIVDLSVVTLVGVVTGGDLSFCIVEDAEGVSYVLRKGDRVKNGRVVSINPDALVASQTILGYTTTLRLRLQEGKDVKNG